MTSVDFLVIGGGIIGACIARELKRRHPDQSVVVLEKEATLGFHASGRNSGVLHAGFYYTADSLKARFTRDGNRYWRAFCGEHGLKVNACGKLVLTKNESELDGLEELFRRAQVNGVEMERVDERQAKEIEPTAKTCQWALWSPATATVDPREVLAKVVELAQSEGVAFRLDSPYLGRQGRVIRTKDEELEAGYVVNAAGLHADRIARDFGFAEHLTMIPFKGLYLYSDEPKGTLRTNLYPVPNLRNPFLGVHYTVTVDGKAKIGPTAIPAFWREHYGGLSRFRAGEALEILTKEAAMFFSAGFDFRSLALEEVKKYWRPYLVAQAAALREGVDPRQYRHWGQPGIRAQLMDVRTRKLIMDFCGEGDEQSYHVLNAVSPGFTCAIPFSAHVVDQIESLVAPRSLPAREDASVR